MSGQTNASRRKVLRTTGGLAGFGAVTGVASAACYNVQVDDTMADVYDSCNGSYIGCVHSDATGVTCDKCYDANGDTWWHCTWDSATPDGWVHESWVTV